MTLYIDESFLKKLNDEFHIAIPDKAFVAMDYHLNWIFAAAILASGNKSPGYIFRNVDKVIDGTQEDIDLLVAFLDESDSTHLIMLEAKGFMPFNNKQFAHKMERFKKIFGDDGRKLKEINIKPYFGFISRIKPKKLDYRCCPSWMKIPPPWIEMEMDEEKLILYGCDELGKSNNRRDFWTIKPE